MREESQYTKIKIESLVTALSISIILGIAFSYLPFREWWHKLLFEIISQVILFILNWKLISSLILKIQLLCWKKRHREFCIDGKWYVLHLCEARDTNKCATKKDREIAEAHNNYVRIGMVHILQNMDEIRLEGGRNYSIRDFNSDLESLDLESLNSTNRLVTTGAKWYSSNVYRLSCETRELFGIFNVKRDSDNNEADGVHFLTVESSDLITGKFYNSTNRNPFKPDEGEILLFRDKDTAKKALLNEIEKRKHD